jgi:peptide/nickel transport system permease protein
VNRLLHTLLLLFLVSVLIFSLTRFIPGDPAMLMLEYDANPEQVEILRHKMGLDRPVHTQYFVWLRDLLVHGDMGDSMRWNEKVVPIVLERYPRTLSLVIWGFFVSLFISLVAGIISARRHNTWTDLGITTLAMLGISVPRFWLAIMFMLVFSVYLGWLPTAGWVAPGDNFVEYLKHLIMPGTALGLAVGAVMTRMVRSSLLEVLFEGYITTARAKGVRERGVLWRHALRNALIPVVTFFGIQVGYMMGGTVVIEQVFNYPGVGQLIVDAIFRRDYPLVQAGVLAYAVTFILVNFITDMLYPFLDPRVKVA